MEKKETDNETILVPKNENVQTKMRDSDMRWLALTFTCFTMVGDFYCMNLFTALQSAIKENFDLGDDNTKFNFLSSVGSVPGIILPFLGGMIIDRFGVRPVYISAAAAAIIGYSIITLGIAYLDFNLLIMGKLVAAFGMGPLFVSKSAMLVKWFAGKELSLALGAALVFSRVASSLDSIISPRVYEWTRVLAYPFVIGVGVTILSLMATLGVCYLDKKADLQEKSIALQDEETAPLVGSVTEKPKAGFKDILKFPSLYFWLILNVAIITPPLFVFMGNLNELIQKRFSISPVQAGEMVPVIYYISFLVTPLTGYFVDRQGKRLTVIFGVMIIFLASHLYITFLPDAIDGPKYDVLIGLIGFGIFYATYSAVLLPSIALVVKKELAGLAFGFSGSISNIDGVIMPLVFAFVHDNTKHVGHGYFWVGIVAIGFVILGFIVLAIIYFIDKKSGGRLQRPAPAKGEPMSVKASKASSDYDRLN